MNWREKAGLQAEQDRDMANALLWWAGASDADKENLWDQIQMPSLNTMDELLSRFAQIGMTGKRADEGADLMSRNEKRIREALAKTDIEVESLIWEPISSGCEMEGPRGGWLLNDSIPLGYSTEEAIEYVRTHHGAKPADPKFDASPRFIEGY